ncbi:MAG: (Fe-S)-binding protein, partial [Halothiobacillus sp.]|nr:(Fe-S)-binding protein [Halothiobacillus sp.]
RNLSAVVVIGTACASELQRDPGNVPFMEITDFLAQVPDDQWPQLQPNAARVAIHLPCSQTRVLKQPRSTEQLLQRIPELNLVPLATNDRCCGAAGMHVLMYPDQADALRAPKLDEIEQLNPDFVVSANIGCATHIAVGLNSPVLHPVELIAKSLTTTLCEVW